MSEGVAVSLVWLLVIMLALQIVTGCMLLAYLGEIVTALRALNVSVLRWRKQFSETFSYIDEGEDSDIWGDEDEQEARNGR